MGKHKASSDPRTGRKKTYPQEVIDFIKGNCGTMTDSKLSVSINKRFNLNTTQRKIVELRRYYGIYTGRKNRPTFAEKTRSNGYTLIKNAAGKWVLKHSFLYEQAHGKVPKGYVVIFLDKNKNNFSLDNLAAVSLKEQMALTILKLRFNNPELTRTGIAIVKHKNKIMARRGNSETNKTGNNRESFLS